MKLTDILKPKSRDEVASEFCQRYQINRKELQRFYNGMKWHSGITSWIKAVFMWVFGLSMIVNFIMALSDKYFWFPIHQTRSMLAFINIFWVISCFVVALIIIVWGIMVLYRYYNQEENNGWR